MAANNRGGGDTPRAKRTYKLWKNDEDIEIPIKTLRRWEKNMQVIDDTNTSLVVASTSGANDGDQNQTFSDDEAMESDTDSNTEGNESDLDYTGADSDPVSISSSEESESSLSSGSEDSDVENFYAVNRSLVENDQQHGTEPNIKDRTPVRFLYNHCSMSIDEAVLELLDLYLKHKWTKASLSGCLAMLHRMLPDDNLMPKTLFKLFQYVKNYAPPFNTVKHYFCKKCINYIGLDSKIKKCPSCNEEFASKKDIGSFFEVDIEHQIRFMFEHRNLGKKLKNLDEVQNDGSITDITDGTEYTRVNVNRKKYDLTLILNTDGLSLVKSEKSHCWPLMFTICELPEHLRESFLVVIGLWYDNSCKPAMNMFLEPFSAKFRSCFINGISWTDPQSGSVFTTKITVPLIVADAPARASLQNILNFNGRYGCNLCEIQMVPAKKIVKLRNCSIYPYVEDIRLRTGRKMKKQAKKMADSEGITHIKGVKGSTILSKFPMLDLGTCFIPEYMHSSLLGAGHQFLEVWLTKGPWSLKKKIKNIDLLLLSIKPPHFFNRMPRSLMKVHYYKASEMYNFILFYSLPILKNYLDDKFLNHWMLFVRSLYLLLQERITEADLCEAKRLLKIFVKKITKLYGDRKLSYNVHQLLHLTLVVERWGPLWATSAFPFENMNGFLANNVHGSKHLGQEIVNNLAIIQGTEVLRNRVLETKTELDKTKKNSVVGVIVKHPFSDDENDFLQSKSFNPNSLCVYARAKINNEYFTSEIYKIIDSNSYTVQINCLNGTVYYGSVRFFFYTENQLLCILLNKFRIDYMKFFFDIETDTQVKHIIPIIDQNSFIIIQCNEIKSITHLIRVDNYVCKRPNHFKKVF